MDIFRKKEKESIYNQYSNYKRSDKGQLRFRPITGYEYESIPNNFKSKLRMFMGKGGLGLLFTAFFVLGSIKYTADQFISGDKDRYISLMIFGSVDLFMLVIFAMITAFHLDKLVRRDSLAAAGEVLEVNVVRRGRGGIMYADHTIAVHATREIVVIRYYKPFYAGTTVLIVKSPKMNFNLVPISRDAADMNYIGSDYSAEISEHSIVNIGDLSEYQKIPFTAVRKHYLDREEFLAIPKKYRSVRPFSRGLTSGSWVVFTAITAFMCVLLAKFIQARDIEKAFPMFGGVLCIMIIELLLTKEVFRTPLKLGRTYSIDCVVIRKEKFSGQCIVSIILPESKQYVDNIRIDPMVFDSIETNTNVRLYFNMKYADAKFVSGIF
ncbi:MAG: hypothetical protein J5582_10790 [Ruminococcus sp.]|uniref:hypothetical protein n=1 Tax=Ruminococcus sp. TaxID=41978 RepID=UPI0025DF7B32|nr:hypothetical protein [Ruminococcus sp.]MBO4867026.1 hypothetical protein [Ruminococcus sp.]